MTHLTHPAQALISVAVRWSYPSEQGQQRLLGKLPPADRAAIAADSAFGANMRQDALEATRQGAAGTVADAICYARGLGQLRPARISGPVVLLHGTADTIVKPNVAIAAQQMVPGSRLRWVEGAGHFMLASHPELLLDEVVPAAR